MENPMTSGDPGTLHHGGALERYGSIAGFLIGVCGLVYLILTDSILSPLPAVTAIQCASFALMIWARITFGRRSFHAAANPTEGGLVQSGSYKYWRHPIYASVTYFAWASALSHFSLMTFLAGCAVTAGLFVRMLLEEKLLRRKYPEYEEYMKRTGRFIPGVW
jgi:protein-S-isoprenylcysteine O-methyltransferase Ste14